MPYCTHHGTASRRHAVSNPEQQVIGDFASPKTVPKSSSGKSLGRVVGYAPKCQLVSTPEMPASGRSQRKNRYVTAHVIPGAFNEATIAADAFACRRRPVWRELL